MLQSRLPELVMATDGSSGVPRCVDLRVQAIAGGREVRTTDVRGRALDP